MVYFFFLPVNTNIYQLKYSKHYLLVTLNNRYFWFMTHGNFITTYSKEFNLISIKVLHKSKVFKQYTSILNYFIFSWVSLLSKKIKFKHKGAWISVIRSKVRLLVLNFRLAHLSYLFNQRSIILRRKKHFSFHTLLCLGYSTSSLLKTGAVIYNFFKLNKFTFRGVRFSRQRLIKKEGKVSKYMIDLKK